VVNLYAAISYHRKRRKEIREKSWGSPSSTANDLGVIELLLCTTTRPLFLQVWYGYDASHSF